MNTERGLEMGMYDYINCKHDLPIKVRDGAFQTKDTPRQFLDTYEISDDGTLWVEEYDIEDRSDPKAEGIDALVGIMTRVNKRWVRCKMTGGINFYGFSDETKHQGWVEFSAYFVDGEMKEINVVENHSHD